MAKLVFWLGTSIYWPCYTEVAHIYLLNYVCQHDIIKSNPWIFFQHDCQNPSDFILLNEIGAVQVHDGKCNCMQHPFK